ncbi:MAG: acetolactate synthase large subunit, partial [Nostoc sp.]
PAEVGKNRVPEVPIVGDVQNVLVDLLRRCKETGVKATPNQNQEWLNLVNRWREEYPLIVPHHADSISPQEVIVEVSRQAPQAFYTTDVGQHQMWAAQF